ncbi:hypothetical protein [Georgenia sp. 311]|uniref:hypothetical protein n=1 Tax=Georgenia sp. 311 TaxID=2585134 RepID=UPI001C3F4889|nr:hypothetical protein [Georgenia sp. 311]
MTAAIDRGAWAAPRPGSPVADEPQTPGRGRALTWLLLFLLGTGLVAVGLALGLGAVWEDLFAWALPRVAGEPLPG